MGRASRRKKLKSNYGKPLTIDDMTELEWKKYLRYTDREWEKVKPHFRVVETVDDVDDSVDGVWIYTKKDGKRNISYTGSFAQERFHLLCQD